MLWCGCSVEAPTNMGRKSLTREGVSYGCGLREAWWRGGDGSWRRGRGRLWSLSPTGLKTGHYLLNEFGARGRRGSVRRWRRLLGWGWLCGRGGLWSLSPTGLKTGHYLLNEFGARGGRGGVRRWRRLLGWGWLCGRGGLWSRSPTGLKTGHYRGSLIRGRFGCGVGREAVVVVGLDGIADGFTPAVRAECVDVFVLGDVDGLHESLDQVGDGVGGFGFYIAADNGRDEACQGGAEIAGGEVVAGEEVGQVFAEFLCGAGSGFFLGVVEAEVGIFAGARSAATAAIRERKRTQGHAVLWTERGHKSLLRVEFWDCLLRRAGPSDLRANPSRVNRRYKTETPRLGRGAVFNRDIVPQRHAETVLSYLETRVRLALFCL